MHELAICQALIEQVQRVARDNAARRIVSITVSVGPLLGAERVDATDSARRVSWGMREASLLGSAALIAAVVLFLHRVWGGLPTAAQFSILTAAPLAFLAGIEVAFARRADHYYVALLALAAGVIFVMELNVLGSILNLTDSPHVLLAWALFGLLMAYAYGLRLLLGAGLVLLNAYSAALVLNAQGYYWAGVLQTAQLFIPGAALLYCIPWLTRGRGPYRRRQPRRWDCRGNP